MIISELLPKIESISKSYAAKNSFERSSDWFLLKLQEEIGELTQAHLKLSRRARFSTTPETDLQTSVADEWADVFCHVLLYAAHHNIDLQKSIHRKWLSWHNDSN